MSLTRFSARTALAVIIANMIGTGVFTSLGFQLLDIQSGFVLMMLWAVGGVTALCGALCYAELGAALPRSGGEYNFLTEIYHPAAGYISGWVSATIGFAAPTALASITFGTYLSSIFPELSPTWLACGLILVAWRGPLALLLLGLGSFFVLFYTWPLKYIGLGEFAVLIVWGPLMIGGGYFVVTGEWSWTVVLAGLPYALGVTTVIFGKHIDKHDDDNAKGIHTLPVILGERPSRYLAIGMMVLMYVLVVYLILAGYFIWIMLIVFLAITVFRQVVTLYLKPRPDGPPEWYPTDTARCWFGPE